MKNYLIYLMLGLFFAACSQEDGLKSDSEEERVPLIINAIQEGTTRVMDNMWEEDDAIGVTIFQEGNDVNPVAFNLKYVRTVDGKFVPDTSDKTLGSQFFFLEKGVKYRVVAYYPWTKYTSETEGNPYLKEENGKPYLIVNLNHQDKVGFSNIDILTSKSTYEISKDNNEVQLYFKHTLMKWVVNIGHSNNVTKNQLKGLECNAIYQQGHAQISLLDFSFKDTGRWDVLYLPMLVSEDGTKAEAILHPKQDDPCLFIKLKDERTGEVPLDRSLQNTDNTGLQYTFTVRVRPMS